MLIISIIVCMQHCLHHRNFVVQLCCVYIETYLKFWQLQLLFLWVEYSCLLSTTINNVCSKPLPGTYFFHKFPNEIMPLFVITALHEIKSTYIAHKNKTFIFHVEFYSWICNSIHSIRRFTFSRMNIQPLLWFHEIDGKIRSSLALVVLFETSEIVHINLASFNCEVYFF